MNEPRQSGAESHALRTDGISKHFGAVRAIDELTLAIRRGVTTSVVGPNGSGKSTLVNVLSGVLPLDGGLVIIDGQGLRVVRSHDIAQRGLTRTFQEVRLFDQIKVIDNILVVLTERRLVPALLQRRNRSLYGRAREILELVGMWEKRDALAGELSYGQRKLIEIGRALAMGAEIYLLDEPFAGLFPQMVERVKAILRRMREERRTIVFISHNMEIVRELSDQIVVLESGSLLAEGQVDPVLASPEVIEAYLGE